MNLVSCVSPVASSEALLDLNDLKKKSRGRQAKCTLKGDLLRYYANNTHFDVVELQQLKAFYDKHANEAGLVSLREFKKIFNFGDMFCKVLYRKFTHSRRLQPPPEKDTRHIVYKNKDPPVGFWFAQFIETTICLGPRANAKTKALFIFQMFDLDGDGFIQKKEFHTLTHDCMKQFANHSSREDKDLLYERIETGWDNLMSGTTSNKLNFQDFQHAVRANPNLLVAFSLNEEWAHRILSRPEAENDCRSTMCDMFSEKAENDCLKELLQQALVDPRIIENVREVFRDNLCERFIDVMTLKDYHYDDMGISEEIRVKIKLAIKNHPQYSPEITQEHAVKDKTVKKICLFFCVPASLLLIAAAVLVTYFGDGRTINDIFITVLFGRISIYLCYFFSLLTLLVLSPTYIDKFLGMKFMSLHHVVDFKFLEKAWIYLFGLCAISHGLSHIFTYAKLSSIHDVSVGEFLSSTQGVFGVIALILTLLIFFPPILSQLCFSINSFSIAPMTFIFVYTFVVLIHAIAGISITQFKLGTHLTWLSMLPIFIMYTSDKIKLWYSMYSRQIIKADQKLGNVMHLRVHRPDDFLFRCGQFIWMRCKEVSTKDWRLMHMTSSPLEPFLSFHITGSSDWSQGFYERCLLTPLPEVDIIGPSGPGRTIDFKNIMVIVSGDGINGAAATILYLAQLVENNYHQLENVYVYWIVKRCSLFQWFYEILIDLEKTCPSVHIRIFDTGKTGAGSNLLSALSFNTKPIYDPHTEPRHSLQHHGIQNNSHNLHKSARARSASIKTARPDFAQEFNFIRKRCKNGGNRKSDFNTSRRTNISLMSTKKKLQVEVGVFYFGSSVVGNRLRSFCGQFSDQEVLFTFYHEFIPIDCPALKQDQAWSGGTKENVRHLVEQSKLSLTAASKNEIPIIPAHHLGPMTHIKEEPHMSS